MKSRYLMTACLLILSLPFGLKAHGDEPTPTPVDRLQVERLQLEIERLKLENERLQLEMKSLRMGGGNATPVVGASPAPATKDGKQYATDMSVQAESLAKENAADLHKVVLDLTNGEIWYKGVRSNLNDFASLCRENQWKVKDQFIKYDINGDSLNRTQYQNLYLDRYNMQSRGVFVYEAPTTDADITFTTPETLTQSSSFNDFRNHFETAYFSFDRTDQQKDFKILRFKHRAGFLGFDDVLEVWFDSHRNFVRLKWGMLDKK